jgi:aspartate/glutamate racemase
MTRVGLLHTVPALAGSFDAALSANGAALVTEHLVDASLLQSAIDVGVTPEVRERVARHVRTLVDDGAEAVLVTCSSIGEAVDEAAAQQGVPVLRVDRPMAREAIRLALAAGVARGRIAVLATLAATLGPTGRLIAAEAAAVGADVEVTSRVVEGAAAARAAGDQGRHDALIRAAVQAEASVADVIVLAQASMAAAVTPGTVDAPVLTSPAGGVAALIAAVVGGGPAEADVASLP